MSKKQQNAAQTHGHIANGTFYNIIPLRGLTLKKILTDIGKTFFYDYFKV
jgi:hypothetical protein